MRYSQIKTIGWRPTCECKYNEGSGKAVVLDPFAGTGTTLLKAEELGRDSVAIEMGTGYYNVIEARARSYDRGAMSKNIDGELLVQATLF